MSTAIFELLSQLALPASADRLAPLSPRSQAPLKLELPTEEACLQFGRDRPILFFYEPGLALHTSHDADREAEVAVAMAASDTNPGITDIPAGQVPDADAVLWGRWPPEMSAARLAAPGTSVLILRVANAEDDLHATLSTQEVWPEWPRTIRGWQLCPVSHVCVMLRIDGEEPPRVCLLASRYELVGTSAVYERYLLLKGEKERWLDQNDAERNGRVCSRAISRVNGGSISITELRSLRRVACLCRCYHTRGIEVQRRSTRPHGSRDGTLLPPFPLTDYILHLVPASMQHTFCSTTTPLLSVSEEDRCQAWAIAAAEQSRLKLGLRQKSSSTEVANTSGVLSEGGHTTAATTYWESTSQSRDRSSSTVHLVEGGGPAGAMGRGRREDTRSIGSTPARPTHATNRADEMPTPAMATVANSPAEEERQQRRCESSTEQRLPPSQRWFAMTLRRLVDSSFYDAQVPAGWRRWCYASGGILCRPLVVDSLDGIVRYVHGSRLAFYTSVAFLDRFIAVTVDPIANFSAYRRQTQRVRSRQELDCQSLMLSRDGRAYGDLDAAQLYPKGLDASVYSFDVCNFLTQVIVVCSMLGCKTIDLYPPRIRHLMDCVEDTAPISELDFVILEFHVLLTLGFPTQPVTLFESVSALLNFSTSDTLYSTLTASHTVRRLLELHQDRGHLVKDVDRLFEEEAEQEAAMAVTGAAQASPRPATLSATDRHTLNSWLQLRQITFFICDEVIRADAAGSTASAPDTPNRRSEGEDDGGDDGDCNVLQYSPVLVAAAALVTAAEQLNLPLPAPLLRLLPSTLRDRLREAPSGASDNESDVLPNAHGCGGATSTPRGYRTAMRDVKSEGSSLRPPHQSSSSISNGVHDVRSGGSNRGPLSLIAHPCDDHYKVLVEISVLLEQELHRLSTERLPESPPRSVLPATLTPTNKLLPMVDDEQELATATAVGWSPCPTRPDPTTAQARGFASSDALHRGGCSLLPGVETAEPFELLASAGAVDVFSTIIAQVKAVHGRSRENCPPVLLERYQALFREAVV